MNKFLLLSDYNYQFWLKTNYKEESVDTGLLKEELCKLGYNVVCKRFSEIDFQSDSYAGFYVFYQSSEDPDLLYQSFIEDILLALKTQGAVLIPDFIYFRAHHNKVFMEMMRQMMGTAGINNLKAWYFGTFEDYIKSVKLDRNKKYVFKLASGAQSKKVYLIKNTKGFYRIPFKKSRSFNLYYWAIDQIKPFLKKTYPGYRKKSHNRRKFIVQEFIPDLKGDFKVLVFFDRLYVLRRRTKQNDFRASGSGLFDFLNDVPFTLLDFSMEVFGCFKVPFVSLDIAMKDNEFYLLEFQFVHFGTYTAEKAPFHFMRIDENWQIVEESVQIESEYARAIHWFINNPVQNNDEKQVITDEDNLGYQKFHGL